MKKAYILMHEDGGLRFITRDEDGTFSIPAISNLSNFDSLTDFDSWLKGFQDPGHDSEEGDYVIQYFKASEEEAFIKATTHSVDRIPTWETVQEDFGETVLENIRFGEVKPLSENSGNFTHELTAFHFSVRFQRNCETLYYFHPRKGWVCVAN